MGLETCIDNVGEYYSTHYLASTFTKDLARQVAVWKQKGSQATPRRLQGLSDRYFQAKSRAVDEPIPEQRLGCAVELDGWHAHLLDALGYRDLTPLDVPVDGGNAFIRALGRLHRHNKPWLVICETVFSLPDGSLQEGTPSEDPLAFETVTSPLCHAKGHKPFDGTWADRIGQILTSDEAPRWVLFLAGAQVFLLDRQTYDQGRWLAFDLDEAFGRDQKGTFDHVAALLSRETLSPGAECDELLHDRLKARSHGFAHDVTESLRIAVREAIELLVNAWAADRTERLHLPLNRLRPEERMVGGQTIELGLPELGDGTLEITAEYLKREALVYVYRLLFCFYAEAHGRELNILPVDDEIYRKGYSLEALRDLEQVPLTPTTEDGTYFQDHLKTLFGVIHQGFDPTKDAGMYRDAARDVMQNFSVRPLTATLFSPESTPLLDRARLTNRSLQPVIRRLSLSTDQKSGKKGRVSYAELGINQLGAVYEGLLSYKGMFADRDLIRVKPAGKSCEDAKTPTWFVTKERLEDFGRDEVERLKTEAPRIYKQGTFVLHLNGIDRKQSASYYTPEKLTDCLVEESLRELLKSYGPEDADRILDLKVCEPAMGSGAFLNEAARQLADRYLELKQKQLGRSIDPASKVDELRRVKHFITTRNVYGVDLNATAVELGALSLWLGSIHRLLVAKSEDGGRDEFRPGATPWFGLRLRCGNSLVGARRAVWTEDQLRKGKHLGKKSQAPRLLKPGEKRGAREIYHFLVFDEEMVPVHRDKLMKVFWQSECARTAAWIKSEVKRKWDSEEIEEARVICDRIDELWMSYSAERAGALKRTDCTATVWPQSASSDEALQSGPALAEQEVVRGMLEAAGGSYQRLKLVMDSWCLLWFWPIAEAENLPSRRHFLGHAQQALKTGSVSTRLSVHFSKGKTPFREQGIAGAFHHWELEYPEVLGPVASHSGFDLIVGNPPWVRIEADEKTILAEIDPLIGVRKLSPAKVSSRRGSALAVHQSRAAYFGYRNEAVCVSRYLSGTRIHHARDIGRGNLYKNFIVASWGLVNDDAGVVGLIHEEGPFTDVNGGALRQRIYPRLRGHYHFRNRSKLFPDVHPEKEFSLNVYGSPRARVEFRCCANLVNPSTLAPSIMGCPTGYEVPGLRTADGRRSDARPHPHRVVTIGETELSVFCRLAGDDDTTPLAVRLPQIHSREILDTVKRISDFPSRLKSLSGKYFGTGLIQDTEALRSRTIEKSESPSFQPLEPEEWIVVGPHFGLANPFASTARTKCTHREAYDGVDLVGLPSRYFPRSPFRISRERLETLRQQLPCVPASSRPVTADFRHVQRRRVCNYNERTLFGAIVPPGAIHMSLVYSLWFKDALDLVVFSGAMASLPVDFLVRVSGKEDLYGSVLEGFPVVTSSRRSVLAARCLRLTCLTSDYAPLWREVAPRADWTVGFCADDERLGHSGGADWGRVGGGEWNHASPLRTDMSRRQALLEIDALVALELGLSLDELCAVYRAQFPLMRRYEVSDLYDTTGQRLPNADRQDAGSSEVRNALLSKGGVPHINRDSSSAALVVSWTVDDGRQPVTKTFYPPFRGVDREADYARAYEIFQRRFASPA